MIKKIIAIVFSAVLISLCGCSRADTEKGNADGDNSLNVYQQSDGTIVYEYSTENSFEEIGGGIIVRNGTDNKADIPEGGISIEEAEKIVDSCEFEPFYLSSKTSDYRKYYYETIEIDEEKYYLMCFYTEKNSVRIFTGTDFAVSCDGKAVKKKDWTGAYRDVEIGSAEKNKSPEDMFGQTKITAVDALLSIISADKSKLGLTESLQSYIFEGDTKLYSKIGINCYKFTPKVEYKNGIKMGTPIYIAADGSGKILMQSEQTGEYEQVI